MFNTSFSSMSCRQRWQQDADPLPLIVYIVLGNIGHSQRTFLIGSLPAASRSWLMTSRTAALVILLSSFASMPRAVRGRGGTHAGAESWTMHSRFVKTSYVVCLLGFHAERCVRRQQLHPRWRCILQFF